jgi:hypothetical protein
MEPTDWLLPEQMRMAIVRVTLTPTALLELPPFKGSFLRGVLGATLKRLVCAHEANDACPPCRLGNRCPYGYLFEPAPPEQSQVTPKMRDVPLPFVLEPPPENRMLYQPGDPLSFTLVLIGRGVQYLPYLVLVFEELGQAGLGRRRVPCPLSRVEALHPLTGAGQVIYTDGGTPGTGFTPEITTDEVMTHAQGLPVDQMTLRFLTPTRIKHQERYTTRPDFAVLVRALLRRVHALAYFHGDQHWKPDLPSLLAAAAQVKTAAVATHWSERTRYSARQGQGMSLSGFVGEVIYQGDLAPFRALLVLGAIVHVGKATVFGNGKYEIGIPDPHT